MSVASGVVAAVVVLRPAADAVAVEDCLMQEVRSQLHIASHRRVVCLSVRVRGHACCLVAA